MTYYSYTKRELSKLGLQENELTIYTGTVNPQQPNSLSPGSRSKNAYVYLWWHGEPLELNMCFRRDRASLDILEIRAITGAVSYTHLTLPTTPYV